MERRAFDSPGEADEAYTRTFMVADQVGKSTAQRCTDNKPVGQKLRPTRSQSKIEGEYEKKEPG